MLKKIVLAVLGLAVLGVAGLAIAISMQPDEYIVTRAATIAAPPEPVFDQINDFRKWDAWSPWAKLDPNMKVTHSGSQSGKGAGYAWTGNSDVGEGRMTIIESTLPSHVKIDLEFIKPFESRSVTEFMLKPDAGKTNVTWNIVGKHNLISKAMCLVVSMDQLIGPDLEKGLAQLKTVTEAKGTL